MYTLSEINAADIINRHCLWDPLAVRKSNKRDICKKQSLSINKVIPYASDLKHFLVE